MRRLVAALAVMLSLSCGIFESDESRIRIGVQGDVNTLRQGLEVRLAAPGWSRTISGFDITSSDMANYTPEFETPERGRLSVAILFEDVGEEAFAADTISLDIRRDWIWAVTIWRGRGDPLPGCFGCIGRIAIPIGAMGDSLYVVWGGNSIKNPVIY